MNNTALTKAPQVQEIKNNTATKKPSRRKKYDSSSYGTTSKEVTTAEQINYLESRNQMLEKLLLDIISKVEALNTNIDWENNKPFSKVSRFFLFTTTHWGDVLDIIKLLIKIVRKNNYLFNSQSMPMS